MSTPNELLTAAACFGCLPEDQRDAIRTYLLYLESGSVLTPSQLLAAAACFACLTPDQRDSIEVYLLSLLAGDGCCPLFGNGNPNGVETANKGRIYFDLTDAANPIMYVKTTNGGSSGWI